jgi:CheY-like chemotaxis protein
MLMIEIEDTGIGITKENRNKLFQPFAQVCIIIFKLTETSSLINLNRLICISASSQAQHRTGGTGLGLYSLSKRLESLGGNCGVDIRSDGASGSCFWISIPYRPDRSVSQSPLNRRLVRTLSLAGMRSPQQSVKHSKSEPQLAMLSGFISHECDTSADEQLVHELQGSRLHGLRILLVDDSALIRKATSRSLVNEGYLVEVARQGAECLKVLEASRAACKSGGYGFDVVLMDLQMPVMDGLEATRRIRAMEMAEAEAAVTEGGGGNGVDRGGSTVSRRITIIGVSAHTEGEARAECADCGMDSFIEKPLQMKHLRRCLLSMGVDVRDKVEENVEMDDEDDMEIVPIE